MLKVFLLAMVMVVLGACTPTVESVIRTIDEIVPDPPQGVLTIQQSLPLPSAPVQVRVFQVRWGDTLRTFAMDESSYQWLHGKLVPPAMPPPDSADAVTGEDSG